MLAQRCIPAYSPQDDFADRYGGWSYRVAELHGLDEVIDVPRQLLLIDPKGDGEAWALAHAIGHLDLRHHEDQEASFTPQQEADANGLAALRMEVWPKPWPSRERDDVPDTFELPPFDGEPSVRTAKG